MTTNQSRCWRALEQLATGAVMAEWQRELGPELPAFQPFLQLSSRTATTFPCTNALGCGIPHRLQELSPGRWMAICDPDEFCVSFRVEEKDLPVFEVAWARFCPAVAKAVGLDSPRTRQVGRLRARAVGFHKQSGTEFFVLNPGDSAQMAREVERMFCAQLAPFVVLSCSGTHCSTEIQSALRRQGCAHAALSEVITLHSSGKLAAIISADALVVGTAVPGESSAATKVLKEIHKEVAAIRKEHTEIRAENERLKQMQAEGLFKFTQQVDAKTFKVLCMVLAQGDVAKASRELNMKDSTLRELIKGWSSRGKAYALCADLVRWRKKVGRKEIVPLNDAVLLERTDASDHADILSDVLDGLASMTETNWQDLCNELTEMLQQHRPT